MLRNRQETIRQDENPKRSLANVGTNRPDPENRGEQSPTTGGDQHVHIDHLRCGSAQMLSPLPQQKYAKWLHCHGQLNMNLDSQYLKSLLQHAWNVYNSIGNLQVATVKIFTQSERLTIAWNVKEAQG